MTPARAAPRSAALAHCRGERRPYPRDATVHGLFAEQALRSPDAVAAIAGDEQLTYRELQQRASGVAREVGAAGLAAGATVGLYAGRGLDAIAAMLGILQAGAAYLPLDPADPPARTQLMLGDAGASLILAQADVRDRLPSVVADVVCLDAAGGSRSGHRPPASVADVAAMSPAYVMYTSGSTGVPKGVCAPHRAIVRLVVNTDYARLSADEVFLHLAPLSFDAATFEIWGSLLNGAKVVVMPPCTPSIADIADLIAEHEVTTVWMPSGLFSRVAEHDPHALAGVRQLLTGGDIVDPRAVRRVLDEVAGLTVVAVYGPTEATTFSTAHPMVAQTAIGTSIPIGRPIANTTAYILDDELSPVATGTPGELYVGGDGLALGYVNQPAQTAASFVEDPFAAKPGGRLYRTGDRVRSLQDGTIEFLGRADRQVKIRGFRVELAEIDAALVRHPEVGQAVSIARPAAGGQKEIVAYVEPIARRRENGSDAPAPGTAQLVARWQQIYDEVIYDDLEQGGSAPADPTFNTTGWSSSYTGLPLAQPEMREQVDQAVARILERQPRSILEIGCGTGLLLFGLVDGCRRYVGTDFSHVALDYVRRQLEHRRTTCRVDLVRCDALDLSAVAGERFDTVVLNSVVQHLPSPEYLATLLRSAAALVRDGGRIFVGDVRSHALLGLFHSSVEWARGDPSLPMRQFARQVEQQVADERELAVDPAFFGAAGIARLGGVHVQLKRGVHHNELTRFRYDVILDIGSSTDDPPPHPSLRWSEDVRSLDDLVRLVDGRLPERVVLRAVPNRRCSLERWLLKRSGGGWTSETLGELRDSVPGDLDAGSVDPEDLWRLADALGYRAQIGWTPGARDGSYDVQLDRTGGAVAPATTAASGDTPAAHDGPAGTEPPANDAWRPYANSPLAAVRRTELARELREHLQDELPAHMVPAFVVVMASLPATAAGKIDVTSLPPPPRRSRHRGAGRVPREGREEVLSALWEQLLGVEAVESHESFFELGGNSLAAIQLVNAIEDRFGLRISPVAVFERPTLAGLADLLATGGAAATWEADAAASAARGASRRGRAHERSSRRDGQRR